MAAGKAHGAQRADLYGCLYFYLSEQFRAFSARLKRFRISFHILNCDARDLAKDLRSGALNSQGLSKNLHFDRIDVSNIIDTEYVGIPNVLADWAPLLSEDNPCATLFGHSMNWVPKEPDANPDPKSMLSLASKLLKDDRVSLCVYDYYLT